MFALCNINITFFSVCKKKVHPDPIESMIHLNT